MLELNRVQSRVLGVMIEKATTTPEQYPLSLNAATNGANQKNNRDPVTSLSEDEVFDGLESLREKALVTRVDVPGNRVHKYRHNAGEVLHCRAGELAILAELMLRGPQTLGELRGRASRMSPMETLEVTQGLLTSMMTAAEPLVKQISPAPGSRAERFAQLLCKDLHELPAMTASVETTATSNNPTLSDRVSRLEAKVETLAQRLNQLLEKLGESRE